MSISRRKFVQAGTIAAIAAGLALKPTLIAVAQAVTDPLANYTQATFVQYLNSIFRLRGRATVEVTLMKVVDTLPAKTARTGGRESFALHFRGGSVELPQDTYIVEHPALGSFRLFLVPGGADENGAQGYVAVINRLAHAGKPVSFPRKRLDTRRPDTDRPTETKPQQNPGEARPVKRSGKDEVEPETFRVQTDR